MFYRHFLIPLEILSILRKTRSESEMVPRITSGKKNPKLKSNVDRTFQSFWPS